MNKIMALTTSLALMAFFSASLMSCEKPKEEQTAIQSAESWLAIVDKGKYRESWEGLADLFKQNDKEEEWINDLNRSRKPLGKVLERELRHESKSSEASVGEYLIFQYETSFENKKSVVEAVSVIKDKDGNWRILGYSIPSGQ